ncbi:quinone-oxidoreductase qr2 [Quercus suber]|uniref:Quinone-oxidoreductase qr2 n=1 Tax=Quercus suber TaxID=58331 RepID=A0AAW0J711_QUESU
MVDGIIEKGLTLLPKGLNLVQMKTRATDSCLKTNQASLKGGSPYGAGTYVGDGSKQPSELKLDVAFHQEMYFVGISRFRQRHCTATIVNLDI